MTTAGPKTVGDHDGPESLGPWFHNIHLPDGTQTAPEHPLGDFPAYKWEMVRRLLPERLDGKRVLDIGCNGGYYSIELARLGAEVTSVDLDPRYLAQTRWAAARFGVEDRIETRQAQVYELGRWEETFDIVLFLGVLYHLRYPMLALDMVRTRVRERMVFQSLQIPHDDVERSQDDESDTRPDPPARPAMGVPAAPDDPGYLGLDALSEADWPRMAFVEERLIGDPTNWWVPDEACVAGMLRATGFRIGERIGDTWSAYPVEGAAPTETWNRSEYEAVLGLAWQSSVREKVKPRAGTLEQVQQTGHGGTNGSDRRISRRRATRRNGTSRRTG